MLGEKGRLVESSKQKAYLPEGSHTTVPGTISAQDGSTVNISAFISHLDDTTKKRLDRMNQRLRQLELQMEAIETEMTKASEDEPLKQPYSSN